MLLGLVGGLFYAMHVLAKENREDKEAERLEKEKQSKTDEL